MKSKQRVKDHGEVFTPEHIVKEMCDLIPIETWKDFSYLFLEPTCGNGNFLVEIFSRRINHGIDIEISLNTLWGMDILEDNIEECHQRLYHMCNRFLREKKKLIGAPYWDLVVKLISIIENNIYLTKDSLIDLKPNGLFENKQIFNKLPMIEQELKIENIKNDIRKLKFNKNGKYNIFLNR